MNYENVEPRYAEVLDIEASGSNILVPGSEDVEGYVDQYGTYNTLNYYVHATWSPSAYSFISFDGPP